MVVTLSPGDLPSANTYNAADHTKKACAVLSDGVLKIRGC